MKKLSLVRSWQGGITGFNNRSNQKFCSYSDSSDGVPSSSKRTSTSIFASKEEEQQITDIPDSDYNTKNTSVERMHLLNNFLYPCLQKAYKLATDPTIYTDANDLNDEKLLSVQNFIGSLDDNVEVSKSTIKEAGFGLFATKDINYGSIISMYPVHATGVNFDDGSSLWVTLDSEDDEQYFFEQQQQIEGEGEKEKSSNYLVYLFKNREGEIQLKSIGGNPFIDTNPNREHAPGFKAHMMNDGCIVNDSSKEGIMKYCVGTKQKMNCALTPFGPSPLMVAVATREIKEGEEIFTSYGSSYWLDALVTPSSSDADTDTNPTRQLVEKSEEIVGMERDIAMAMFDAMDEACIRYENEFKALQDLFESMKIE